MSLRKGFLWGYLAVILAGIGLSALFTWRAVEQQYLTSQQANLLALAVQSADSLRGQALPAGNDLPYSQTSNALPGIHTRYLSDQGGVVFAYPPASDQIIPPAAENAPTISSSDLLARPEIAAALAGTASTAVRQVPAGSTHRVLYAAAPVLGDAGQVVGLVYQAMPIPAGGLPAGLAVQLLAISVAAAAVMAGLGTVLFRRLLLPVEELARASQGISAGHLEQRVQLAGGIAELDTLGDSFNQMAASLQQSEQTRNAFLADINHELRTPLTVIKGTIETLQDGALDDLTGRDALLAGMSHETDRLIRMVNDLLILTRADSGDLKLNKTTCNLAGLIQERIDFFAPISLKKNVSIQFERSGTDVPLLELDRDRMAQVMDNLLDNALRYSPADTGITVNLHSDEHWILCEVQDSGPGIPADQRERVFERFHRVDPSRGREGGGAGLGLAIVRALLRAHGGVIECLPGQTGGSLFVFRLPRENLPRI